MKLSYLLARSSFAFLLLGSLAASTAAQRDSEFMKAFRQAMRISDLEEMARILQQSELSGINAIVETCELISAGSSDELEADIDGLGRAWKKAFGTNFVDKQYEYFSLLSGEFKRHRKTLLDSYQLQFAEFDKGRKAKDKGKLQAVGLEFGGLSDSFEQIGDLYMASNTAFHLAECFDAGLQGDDADLRRVCTAYKRAAAIREQIGLKDKLQTSFKARYEELEFQGYGDPNKGPEARAKARAEGDASFRPIELGATFELATDVEAVRRPLFHGDSVYQLWVGVSMGKKDSSGVFPNIERGIGIVREASAKAGLDTNGDGKGEIEVPVTGKAGAVTCELDAGQGPRPWGFLATIGQERDTYQGIQPFNLAPNDDQMVVYVAPAASIVGMIGETRIQVFDDNMDGRYGSEPKSWNFAGCREGSTQPDVDSILVGESTRAVPWSRLVKVGEDWYKFEANETFTDVVASKLEVETGLVKLDMKGLECDYLILRGKGEAEDLYFDVAGDKKGVEVPVGSYELFTGRVSKGKRNSMMKALICPVSATPSYRVVAGETLKIEMGEPFGFDFSFTQTDDKALIKGTSIVVTGRGKETYQRLWNCVPAPEASERRVGTKKGGKGEGMGPVQSQEEMIPVGWQYAWFPLDLELEKKKEKEPVEVQLVEKKNKLFGKIESDWKAE